MLADLMRMNGGKSKVTYDVQDATVVNQPYSTSGNGGRKLVRLSNGWLVAGVKTTDYIYFYVYKNNGSEFIPLCYINHDNLNDSDFSIVSKGTVVYIIYGFANNSIFYTYFDAKNTTYENVYSGSNSAYHLEGFTQTSIGNISITINPQGTELHACWNSKNATYPNAFNIRYAKGTISSVDGSVTWGVVGQVTTSTNSAFNYNKPTIILNHIEVPNIISEYSTSPTDSRIVNLIYNNMVLDFKVIHFGFEYTQSSPSAIFVPTEVNGLPQGRVWVAWAGVDSVHNAYNLRVSYSDDGGISWSLMSKVTIFSSAPFSEPSITANNTNNIFICFSTRVFKSTGDASFFEIQRSYKLNKTVLFEPTFSFAFIEPLYIYKDDTKVGFYGKWEE